MTIYQILTKMKSHASTLEEVYRRKFPQVVISRFSNFGFYETHTCRDTRDHLLTMQLQHLPELSDPLGVDRHEKHETETILPEKCIL